MNLVGKCRRRLNCRDRHSQRYDFLGTFILLKIPLNPNQRSRFPGEPHCDLCRMGH